MMLPHSPDQPDTRPILAMVTGHLAPYRVHFHQRVAREIPELRLVTLVTKRRTNQWVNADIPEIGTLMVDPGPDELRVGGAKLRHELRTAARLIGWCKQHRPRAILVGGYDELPGIRALLWAARTRTPALMVADSNIHGDHAQGARRWVKNIYVPWICSMPSAILVCGSAGKAYFRRYHVPESRLFVSPCEPDYQLIENFSAEEADRLAAELGLPTARRRFLSCSRLVPEKRVDLIIRAFERIAAERPEWDLVIVGDGVLRAELESMVPPSLREARRVIFVGQQNQRAVTALYLRTDVLVLASDYEPWALVVNEAACAGRAIIATDRVGAAAELVREGQNGRVIPAGSVDALVSAMIEVAAPGRAARMGIASREVLCDWRSVADPIIGLRKALASTGTLPFKP